MPIGSDRLVLLGSTPGMLSHTRCLMHKRPPGYRATRISFTIQVPIGTPIVVFPLFVCLSGILPFSERTSQYHIYIALGNNVAIVGPREREAYRDKTVLQEIRDRERVSSSDSVAITLPGRERFRQSVGTSLIFSLRPSPTPCPEHPSSTYTSLSPVFCSVAFT